MIKNVKDFDKVLELKRTNDLNKDTTIIGMTGIGMTRY